MDSWYSRISLGILISMGIHLQKKQGHPSKDGPVVVVKHSLVIVGVESSAHCTRNDELP